MAKKYHFVNTTMGEFEDESEQFNWSLDTTRAAPVALPANLAFYTTSIDDYAPKPERVRKQKLELQPITKTAPTTPAHGIATQALTPLTATLEGKILRPNRRREPIDIDTPWSASTWHANMNTNEMLYLLRHAGEDIGAVAGWKGTGIAEYMVLVREKREKNGTVGKFVSFSTEAPDDKAASVDAAKEQPQNGTTETTITAPNDDPVHNDGDSIAEGTATLPSQAKPEHSNDKKNLNQRRDTWRRSLNKFHISANEAADFTHDPSTRLPTLSVSVARSYLLAIKQQAIVDTQPTYISPASVTLSDDGADEIYMAPGRTTVLRDQDGNILLSYEAHLLSCVKYCSGGMLLAAR
jgi:hypothetical protein